VTAARPRAAGTPYPPPVPLYRLADDLPELRDAVLIASFDGWVDAAECASGAVGQIAAGGRVVATFDPDAVFDYRSRRPVLDVQDGRLTDLRWPELTVRHARVGGRDLLVFSGAEPDLRWQELAADAVALVRRLGVAQWVSLGAVPGAVAHTRPVPVMVTASHDDILRGDEAPGPEGLLRVPSAALSVLEMAVTGAGTPAVGFYAQVPPYASIGYAAASIALLARLSLHLDVSLDPDELVEEEREQRARYDAAVAGDTMLRETVSRLESAAGDIDAEQLPSGDEIAREIERFLRRQGEAGENG
jgi:PAC2 family